jgi:hypothetical protein
MTIRVGRWFGENVGDIDHQLCHLVLGALNAQRTLRPA